MENNFEPTSKKSLPLPLIAIIIVILLVASVGGYFLVQSQDKKTASASPQPQAMNNVQEPVIINEKNSVIGENDTAENTTAADITFEISGKSFEYSETELTVNKGDTVKIILSSTDGFHDWRLDEFGAASARVNTGGTTEVVFTADKAGKFEFYCSVGNHRAMGMVGTLTVK